MKLHLLLHSSAQHVGRTLEVQGVGAATRGGGSSSQRLHSFIHSCYTCLVLAPMTLTPVLLLHIRAQHVGGPIEGVGGDMRQGGGVRGCKKLLTAA
jgi:hypothetical protein